MAAASLFQSGLAEAYWEYAVRLAVLATNRVSEPRSKNISKGFSPFWSKYERLLDKSIPTRLNGIYPFGCSVYKHVPSSIRKKFEILRNLLFILALRRLLRVLLSLL